MTSRITAGSIVANTIFVPDSSAIISTGAGSDESLADLLDSKEDRIVITAQRVMATDPGGRPMASLVHIDELNTLQDIDTSVTIQDQFDAVTDVVDILDSRRFEYTWTGSESGSIYVPMMKFPRLNNEYNGTIVIKGHASFKTSVDPASHYIVDVDGKINVNGTGGLQHVVSMRGVWAPNENPPPFDVQVINVQVGGQQGTIYNWVCAVFDSANADFTPSRFNLLLETDMGSALLASDAPIEGSIPDSSGSDLSFVTNAQIFETNAMNVSLRDNALDFGPYSVEASTMTANNGLTLPYLIPGDGNPRPAIIDSLGNVSVTTEATLDDIEALPQMRTNLALLATSIEYDADTRSLYLGKSDMADTIYISNPSSETSQTIYLGSALDHVIIQGDTTIIESETHNVTDPYMTLNVGGTTTTGAGIRVEANAEVAASLLVNGDGRWEVTEPASGSAFAVSSRFATNESAISALQAQIGGGGEGLTGSRALVTTSGGVIATHASTTDTQIGYLSDVTGPLQSQIDGKQATITGAASSAVSSNFTAGCGVVTDGSGKLAVDTELTSTVLGYIKGLTSDAQTQINGKQATITGAASTAVSSDFTAERGVISNSSGKLEASIVTKTEFECLSGVTGPIQDQIDAAAGSLVTDVSLSTPSTFTISDEDALRMYKLSTNNFSTWTNHGAAGPNDTVSYMYVNGTDLYISGSFTTINGVTMTRIAKYDTTTGEWSTFGSGLGAAALFLGIHNGYLYAVGSFTSPGARAVKWDLTNGGWSTVGTGVTAGGTVRSAYLDTSRDTLWVTQGAGISSFDLANAEARTVVTADGDGAIVYGVAVIGNYAYVCGTFSGINSVTASRAARYNLDTSTWDAMPGSATVNNLPNTLVKYGTNLFYCGWMNGGGGVTSRGIVRYDTATDTWYALGSGGISGTGDRTVSKIGIYDATTETFWVNGSFTSAVGTALTVQGIILYNLQTDEWSAIPEEASVGPGVQHMARINNDVFLGGASTTTAGYFATYRDKAEVKSSDGSTVIHEFNVDADADISIVPHDFKVAGDTYLNVGGATDKVLTVDADGKVAAAATPTVTELGYVAGATSSLQTQLNTIFDPTTVQIASTDVTEFNRYYVPYSAEGGSIITKYELTGTDHGKSRLSGGTFASFGTTGLAMFDDDNMYISGWFTDVNGISGTRGVIYYNDKSKTFHALNGGGAGSGAVYSLSAIDHILYVAGFVASGFGGNASIAYIGRYDTVDKTWSLLGGAAPDNTVLSTCVVGRYLFAVGQFSDIGSLGILAMGRYDMETDTWSAVFDDLTTTGNKWVSAIGAFETDVYVTGTFDSIVVDAVDVPNTDGGAKLDVLTGTWSSQFGSTLQVIPLISYPVRGYMYARIVSGSTGVANTTYLARYDIENEVWEAVGGTGPNQALTCAYHDGDNIYFGGSFTSCNSVTGTSRFARYHIPTDTYFATGLTLDNRVMTITPTSTGDLWLCGDFTERFMLYSPNVHVYKNGVRVTTLSNDGKPSAYVINN